MNKPTQSADKVRALLGKLPTNAASKKPPVIQEAAAPKAKVGRKMHRAEGVKYVRISPAIPDDLKMQMDVAIKTTHRDTYPTIDTFIEAAVKAFLK